MKKVSVMVLLVVLLLGSFVFAQEGAEVNQLTEEQLQELDGIRQQIVELRQQMTDKMVEFGLISQERADWIRQGAELRETEGFEYGYGYGYGPCHGAGRAGRFRAPRGGMRGLGW